VAHLPALLRVAAAVLVVWSALSVALSLALSALFRAQARWNERYRRAERRRLWLEAAR
jgi:hypothetical protein